MIYFNQYNYGDVPYPALGYETATVKSGGCGVCCAAMLVSNLTGKRIAPAQMAQYAIREGARVSGGTDMRRLGNALARDYGLDMTVTNDETALLNHLKSGGMAAANVGGNRKGYTGVFSDGGHFIVVAGVQRNKLIILDPGKYTGKFEKTGRRGKVEVKGDVCYCSMDVLAADTFNRSPSYYLFEKVEEEMKVYNWFKDMPDWARPSAEKAYQKGIIKADEKSGAVSVYEPNLQVIVWMDRAGMLG